MLSGDLHEVIKYKSFAFPRSPVSLLLCRIKQQLVKLNHTIHYNRNNRPCTLSTHHAAHICYRVLVERTSRDGKPG